MVALAAITSTAAFMWQGDFQILKLHATQGLDSYSSPWEDCLGGDISIGKL